MTLMTACVFGAGWVRIAFVADSLFWRTGINVVDEVMSADNQVMWSRSHNIVDADSITYVMWKSNTLDSLREVHGDECLWRWHLFGFELGELHSRSPLLKGVNMNLSSCKSLLSFRNESLDVRPRKSRMASIDSLTPCQIEYLEPRLLLDGSGSGGSGGSGGGTGALVAVNDSFTVLACYGSGLVLTNDTDTWPNHGPLTATLESQASEGTVQLNTSGSFIYHCPPEYGGTDSFTYQVSDGSHTATATVTLNVIGATINQGDTFPVDVTNNLTNPAQLWDGQNVDLSVSLTNAGNNAPTYLWGYKGSPIKNGSSPVSVGN